MTQQHLESVVRRSVTVGIPRERAFDVFAMRIGQWWPRDYHIGQVDMADFKIEPKAGGRWYEVGVDGSECQVGWVTALEPPERLVLAWGLNERWQFDPDPTHASEVEVRFIAEGDSQTRVEVEHRGFERHGAGAEGVRGGIEAPSGWTFVLEQFAKHAAA